MGFLGSPNCLKCPPDSARLSGVRFLLSSVILASAVLVHFCWYLFVCFFLFLNACEIYSVLSLDFLFSYWQIFFFLLVYDFFSSSDIFCYDFFFRSLARAVFSSLFGCVLIFFRLKRMPECYFRSLISFLLGSSMCAGGFGSLTWICINSRLFCWAFFSRFLYFGWYNSEHIAISAHLCESQEFYLHFFFTDVHRHEILASFDASELRCAERKVDLLLVCVKKLSLWLDDGGLIKNKTQNSSRDLWLFNAMCRHQTVI